MNTNYETHYHPETRDNIRRLLERLIRSGERVRFYWGDAQTGEDWGDQYDVAGRVSRSTGRVRIPILVHNRRSMGGHGMLDHCIVRVRYANKRDGGDLYRHPTYHKRNPFDPAW